MLSKIYMEMALGARDIVSALGVQTLEHKKLYTYLIFSFFRKKENVHLEGGPMRSASVLFTGSLLFQKYRQVAFII